MATELLGKAHAWKTGPNYKSHKGLVGFVRGLSSNRQAQRLLGYQGKNAFWARVLKASESLAQRIQDLAPAITPDGPNPEYPWPRANPTAAPAEYAFDLWDDLKSDRGLKFLALLDNLFESAEAFL
jgi:hypothetical protein